jgi:hypothetical protein
MLQGSLKSFLNLSALKSPDLKIPGNLFLQISSCILRVLESLWQIFRHKDTMTRSSTKLKIGFRDVAKSIRRSS